MGIKERKSREKSNMRRLILDTAMQLFIEEGYENVQIRKITDKIEYSPGTFYLYFKDKDEVFYILHEEGFAELVQRKKEALSIEDPFERLQRLGEIYIDFALEKPQYYEIMFILRSPMKEVKENWSCGMHAFGMLYDTVTECINKGVFPGADPMMTSLLMMSMVHGFVSLIIRERLKMIPAEAMVSVVDGYKKQMRVLFSSRR